MSGGKVFNRDVRLTGGASLYVNEIKVIDENGNVDAPVTTTDLTVSGTLGVTGATTLGSTLGVTGNVAINTNKFNVTASSGNTTIAGTLGVTGKITGDDVDLASGAVIAGVGTGANGIVLKNLKNSSTSSLSGTQLDVEIDIGGTPYYFTVYPTKA